MKNVLITLLLIPIIGISQSSNLFSDPEAAKTFFDGKVYEVPNYGTLTFSLNKSLTKDEAERSMRERSYDEQVKLVFDVSVKRNNVKKKDKGDYNVYMIIYISEKDDPDADPNQGYSMDFTLKRQIIYPIKGFPSQYTVFADGDLYYQKFEYKKYTFQEYKEMRIKKINPSSNVSISYIQCKTL